MSMLPSGTVTFLFTDIQGSTSLWEHHQHAMQQSLVRHDAIMRSAIVSAGGVVFKTVGDAFYAAFATANAALGAALVAQRELAAESWNPEIGTLLVRMGLHTGAADERDGDYFGAPLNRVARLMSAGHGGQILLSLATQELVRDSLPASASLRDLGQHALKDLARPEHIFQLLVPDLNTDFPPLKTLNARPNNLPTQATPLVGREHDVATACELLRQPSVRLLTMTGLGGTGKTRLSLQVGAEMLDDFSNGVFFVELDIINDPDMVVRTITRALSIPETGEKPLFDALLDFLREKQLLLILDNFEQVIDAAPAVGQILSACPALKIVVTTRIVLHVYGEREFPVPPLSLPNLRQLPPIEQLTQYDAVRLFVERAQACKADFAITNANAPAVAEICHRLDGLPLAIELAAARIKMLPPQAMLARLSSQLKVLTGGARNLPARQQTLRGAIDWSYDLLAAEEQEVFALLAVFVGNFTFLDAEMVCNGDGELSIDMLDGLQSLTDKSLIYQDDVGGEDAQFAMRHMIHEYASERLQASGKKDVVREQHAAYFLSVAEEAEGFLTGSEQALWLTRLEHAHENLRAALNWLVEHRSDEMAFRLCGSLWRYCYARGYLIEGRAWLTKTLALDSDVSPTLHAKVLNGAGILAWKLADYPAAQALLTKSLAIRRQDGELQHVAGSLNNLALVYSDLGDYTTAQTYYQECLDAWRSLGDDWGIATSLTNVGMMVRMQGNLAYAHEVYDESLTLLRKLDDHWGIATTLFSLGEVALVQGDFSSARDYFLESLTLRQELGDKDGTAECFEGIASLDIEQIPPELKVSLFGAAEALREIIGVSISSAKQTGYDLVQASLRLHMNEEAYRAAWVNGRITPVEQLVAELMATQQQHSP